MRTSLTKVSAVAPVRPGGNAATKMPCYAWIRGECKLGDKCRFEHDPKSAPKSGGADEKGKSRKQQRQGKERKRGSAQWRSRAEVLQILEDGKVDPSKGDLEVQRRMAEKEGRESSGRVWRLVLFLAVIV